MGSLSLPFSAHFSDVSIMDFPFVLLLVFSSLRLQQTFTFSVHSHQQCCFFHHLLIYSLILIKYLSGEVKKKGQQLFSLSCPSMFFTYFYFDLFFSLLLCVLMGQLIFICTHFSDYSNRSLNCGMINYVDSTFSHAIIIHYTFFSLSAFFGHKLCTIIIINHCMFFIY